MILSVWLNRLGSVIRVWLESRELSIENDLIKRKLEGIRFYSATYRLFKVLELEPSSENYGQSVIYRGIH